MRCPYCGWRENRVVDSRESREGASIRRRRECLQCTRRFTSYERVEHIPHYVIKKDETREPFDREKLLEGMRTACQKRPVQPRKLEDIADEIDAVARARPDKEISTRELGQLVMDGLKGIDHVAYVRFASVYRSFQDVGDFVEHVRDLLEEEDD